MFASLKNKIREETGSDISKLTQKLTSSSNVQTLRNNRTSKDQQQGSSSSLNSIVSSSDCTKDDSFLEDDYKKRIAKVENEYVKKLEEKEKQLKEITTDNEKRVQNLEKEKSEAYRQITKLKDSLKIAEDIQQRLVEHREDKEQIENFQTQELSKVKYLVLLREQELSEKSNLIKEMSQQVEKLRSEVARLRRHEEQLNDLQDDLESLRHSSARDLASLATDLAKSEEERRHLSDLVAILRQRTSIANSTISSSGDSTSSSSQQNQDDPFKMERKLLEQRLEEAHLHLAEIKTSWSDKIASLETQVGRLNRQAAEESAERRRAVQEKDLLQERLKQMECELECNRLELNNKETKIKRLTCDVEELATELKSLKNESEEEITFLRKQIQNANTEVKAVQKNLENTESELDKNEEECSKLRLSVESEHQANVSLKQLISKLEKELGEEKSNSLDVQKTLTRVTAEKNAALLRNAEISQQMEMVKQDTRRQEMEMNDTASKLQSLEDENRKYKEKESKGVEHDLRNKMTVLEEQLSDKNKNIKTLQLRLADMKKTLQQELKSPTNSFYECDAAIIQPSLSTTKNVQHHFNAKSDEDDVNFKYLKHVIIKFLTSREYEAQHLTKAVSTLLKLTRDEEKLLQDTLEWKMSWFGSRPRIGANISNAPPSSSSTSMNVTNKMLPPRNS